MNLHHSNSSRSKRTSHSRFSPAANAQSIYDTATHQPASAINHPGAVEDIFSQFWTPGLLDRLQAPLTRYRE
jgi:hypothetical protein